MCAIISKCLHTLSDLSPFQSTRLGLLTRRGTGCSRAVSNSDMTNPSWWSRAARLTAAALLLLTFTIAAFVNIQQRVLRWRAERLLADIRGIQMGSSSWDDAQRIMNRWGEWGKWEGRCTPQSCDYQIVLQDASQAYATYYTTDEEVHLRTPARRCCQWLRRPYMVAGGRFAEVYARIVVKDGIIWTKSFDVITGLYPKHPIQYVAEGDVLVAAADGVTRFARPRREQIEGHFEYAIDALGTCTGCRYIESRFTPFADRSIVQQLFDFNLDCLSRWRECEDPGEIMPSAWHLFTQQKSASLTRTEPADSCNTPLEIAARDSRYIGIAKVTRTRMTNEGRWSRQIVSLQSVASLKAASFPKPLLSLGEWVPFAPEYHTEKAESLKPGDQLILLFDNRFDEADSFFRGPGPCGFFKYSQENLDAIQRGINRDALSKNP